jgi:hypothetical protein
MTFWNLRRDHAKLVPERSFVFVALKLLSRLAEALKLLDWSCPFPSRA